MGIFQRRFIYLSEVFFFRRRFYYIRFFCKSNFFLSLSDLHDEESFCFSTWKYSYCFLHIFPIFNPLPCSESCSPPGISRESESDILDSEILILSKYSSNDSLILLWCKRTRRVDESSTRLQSINCSRKELILKFCFLGNVFE